MFCENEGRDPGDVSTSQEMLMITSQPPEAKGLVWSRCSPSAPRRNQPCQHLDLRLLGSRTARKLNSVVEAPQLVELRYGSPDKLS